MNRLIYQDEHMEVIHRPGSDERTLVTYSWAGFPADGQKFWAQPVADKIDINTIGFVARDRNWFFPNCMKNALAAAQLYLKGEIISYGSSMGAFAALKYARETRSDFTIALSPQFSIDPAICPYTRYKVFYRPEWHKNIAVESRDLKGECYVIFDPQFEEDRKHADLLRSYSNIIPIPVHFVGHETVFVVGRAASVERMIDLVLEGDCCELFQFLRQRKKLEPMSLRSFAMSCQARGKYRLARRLLDKAALSGLSPRILGEARFALYNEEGAVDEAAEAAAAVVHYPELPTNSLLPMIAVLQERGHNRGLVAACLAAIGRGLETQALYLQLARAQRALGKHSDALLSFERASERWPVSSEIASLLPWARMAAGKLEESLSGFRELTEQRPSSASYVIGQVDCLRRMGRIAEASELIRQAQVRFPENPDVHHWVTVLKLGEAEAPTEGR